MKLREVGMVAVLLGALTGCSSLRDLPDLDRAEQDLAQGRTDRAQSQLEALAGFGIADAQVDLGDFYRDSDSASALEAALTWYHHAAEQGSERAWLRLGKLYAREGTTAEQRAVAESYLRQSLAAGDDSALIALINLYLEYPAEFTHRNVLALIEQGESEGNPSASYARVLYYQLTGEFDARMAEIESLCAPAVLAEPACMSVLARIYMQEGREADLDGLIRQARSAWETGEIDDTDLYQFAGFLASDEAPNPKVGESYRLYQLLIPGHVPALTESSRLALDNPYLADSEVILGALEQARTAGDLRASLTLARIYELGRIAPADPQKALAYAEEARPRYPAADYTIGRIYKRGYLGKPDPGKALDYLLSAARRGYPKADFLLARLFWEGKGVAINPVYAWSFATLALEGEVAQAHELLDEMAQTTPLSVRQEAERLSQRELISRQQQPLDLLQQSIAGGG
ncbi:SEL1-like repeat protein [Marinobacter sp. M216]|uniref:SEL1-like repeat protein n=1 Tax=Marinobacter albus TaxID=3030833 RepID=A0ABT7HAD0_9GAMM|nr:MULTISPECIES: SEL1-like repeat protein [unclassified Marinobacter]MBW7470399.1 SEL1-like repeat protein [Marinobacter sp. F4218]MDK9557336.1 SEL1-like repeat protein [Marinobacter sp. M216]